MNVQLINLNDNLNIQREFHLSKDSSEYSVFLSKVEKKEIIISCLNKYQKKMNIKDVNFILGIKPIINNSIDEAYNLIENLFDKNKVKIEDVAHKNKIKLVFDLNDYNMTKRNINLIYENNTNNTFICKYIREKYFKLIMFIIFIIFLLIGVILIILISKYGNYKKQFEENFENQPTEIKINNAEIDIQKILMVNSKFNGIPILSFESTGKSTFLNGYFGINFTERKGITIIRHNRNLYNPIFYHVNITEEEEGNYKFIRDSNIYQGKKEIEEKMKEISEKEEKVENENLFWILELNITTIKNEALLNNSEFYDIPVLPKIIGEVNTENFEKIELISNISKYIKSKVDFGIFIVNAEVECQKIIKMVDKIKEVFHLLSLEKLAFIYNKINKLSYNKREEKIRECKTKFLEHFNDEGLNTEFLSVNLRQIYRWKQVIRNINVFERSLSSILNSFIYQNENSVQKNIKYFFIEQLISNIKHVKIDKSGFFDYFLKRDMNKIISNDNNDKLINLDIYKLSLGINDKIINNASKIFNYYSNEINKKSLDFEKDEESKIIIKAFYRLSKLKKINLNINNDLELIDEYFENQNKLITNDLNLNFLNEKDSSEKYNIYLSLKNFIKDFNRINPEIEITQNLTKYIKLLPKYILNGKKNFIPILGATGTGKSTVLNDIIGDKILPEEIGACTKRGIILSYNKENVVELYRVIPIFQNITGNEYLIFETKGKALAKGKKEVISFINAKNKDYSKDEEHVFYLISTHIQMFDELGLSDENKQKIYFIDLPGMDIYTDDAFPNPIQYQKLIETSYGYLFIFKDQKNKSFRNEDNLNMLTIIKGKNDEILPKILNNSLFLINMYNSGKSTRLSDTDYIDEKRQEIKNYTSEVLNINGEDLNLINIELFNALFYSYYIEYKNYFSNEKQTIEELDKSIFQSQDCENLIKKSLEDKMDSIFSGGYDLNKYKINNEKYNRILSIISNKCIFSTHNENTVKEIAKYFEYGFREINNSELFKESRGFYFSKALKELINTSYSHMEDEYSNNIDNIFQKFDELFENKEKEKKNMTDYLDEKYGDLEKKLNDKIWEEKFKDAMERAEIYFENIINSYSYEGRYTDDLRNLIEKKIDEFNNYKIYAISSIIKEINSIAPRISVSYSFDSQKYKNMIDITGSFKMFFISIFSDEYDRKENEYKNNLKKIKKEIINDLIHDKLNIDDKMARISEVIQSIKREEKNDRKFDSWEGLESNYTKIKDKLIEYKIIEEKNKNETY